MEWAQTPWYVFVISAVVMPGVTELLKKWSVAQRVKTPVALLVSCAVAAGGLLIDGKLTWETIGPNMSMVFMVGTAVYRMFFKSNGEGSAAMRTMTKIVAPVLLVALVALAVSGCAYNDNRIIMHEKALWMNPQNEPSFNDRAGDSSSATPGGGGGGTLSPGNGALIDGTGNMSVIINQGAQGTPTTTTDAKASATVQSPNSTTGTGGRDGATPPPVPPVEPEPEPVSRADIEDLRRMMQELQVTTLTLSAM